MQRAELIEYVRLELEDFWDALPELERGAYAFLDNAILIVRDELETLDLKTTKIECLKELGGLLKSYRAAA